MKRNEIVTARAKGFCGDDHGLYYRRSTVLVKINLQVIERKGNRDRGG